MRLVLSGALFLAACSHSSASLAPPADVWKIDDAAAQRIITSFTKSCPFPNPADCSLKGFNRPKHAMKQIQHDHPPSAFHDEWVDGRYDAGDEARYHSLRARPNASREKVGGHNTLLLKLTALKRTKRANVGDVMYFDMMLICPPPSGVCDLSEK